jgi:hypothetical protein
MSFARSSAPAYQDNMLSTSEAGRLVGRTEDAVRAAIRRGALPAERGRDFWSVRATEVVAWAARTPAGRGNPHPRPRTAEVADILREYGSASAEEVAMLLQVHSGNARKYLAILAIQGTAKRLSDGQWVLTSTEKPLAS